MLSAPLLDFLEMLLVGSAVNFVDASGADLLAQEALALRANGITLYLCKLKPQVHDVLRRGGQLEVIGRGNVFSTKDEAIRAIYAQLNVSTCTTCTARVFNECQRLLPDGTPRDPQRPDFALTPHTPTPK